MESAARFGPRHREGRLRPLLLMAAIGFVLLAVCSWFALRADRSHDLALYLRIEGTENTWLWPQEPHSDTSYPKGLLQGAGGPLAARVPVSTGLPEDSRAYLDRMLGALAYEGEPVEIQQEGSNLSVNEHWIVRWTTFLARPPDGGLTQLHLLTVRERSRDWMTPYLLSTDAPDGPAHAGKPFEIWFQAASFGRSSGLGDVWNELPKFFGLGYSPGFIVHGEALTSSTPQQLLDRHGETEWVVERPPDAAALRAEDPGGER